MADEASCVAGEQGQHLKLLARQLHFDAVHRDAARGEVDAESAKDDLRLLGRAGRPLPQGGAQARHQFARGEGLGDVVVGAGVEGCDLLGLAVRTERIRIGTCDHSRIAAIAALPSMSGRPRSSTTASGAAVAASSTP